MGTLFVILLVGVAVLAIYYYMKAANSEVTNSEPTNTVKPNQDLISPLPQVDLKIKEEVTPKSKPLDLNKDGKVDSGDAKEAVKKVRNRVKKTLDVDGDGKVTKKDVKAAVKKVKAPKPPVQ